MSAQAHSRSKTPNGVRQRTFATEGVNPYEPVVTSVHFEQILRDGRARTVKHIVEATSRSGRESTVLFVEQMVEGRRVLDKFRLCCIASNGEQIGIEAALAHINPHHIERLDGANYWLVYIDQRAYDTRACCGLLDLSWSHFLVLCALMGVAGALLYFATRDKADWLLDSLAEQ